MAISMAISVIATTVPTTRCLPSHTTVIYHRSINFSDQKEKYEEEEERESKKELANKKAAHMSFVLKPPVGGGLRDLTKKPVQLALVS
ncbi:hypothetical protein F2Q68_00020132 [Brassica cretica]|uniref:Uncharacterized protein n=1 Tax=Brassica cretica TaxID=69181 RepID=A0A8S9FS06_BRACR|nr:hypothetical protein F2Q68_00020132 [Brassica cretica]